MDNGHSVLYGTLSNYETLKDDEYVNVAMTHCLLREETFLHVYK